MPRLLGKIAMMGILLGILSACDSDSSALLGVPGNPGGLNPSPGDDDQIVQELQAPTGVEVTSIHSFGGTLNWNAVATARSYKIWYLSGLTVVELGEVQTPLTTFELRNFGAGGLFDVGVSACDEDRCSEETFVRFQTLPLQTIPGAPDAPTNVRVTDVHHFGGVLRWNAVLNATSYKIYYLSPTVPVEFAEVAHPQISYVLTNFAAGGTFQMAVSACNGAGCSYATGTYFVTPRI